MKCWHGADRLAGGISAKQKAVSWHGPDGTIMQVRVPLNVTPPPKDKRAAAKTARAKRLRAGRCQHCNRKRTKYKYRCNRCQARERKRWNAAYEPRWHTFRKRTKAEKRLQEYLRRLTTR